MHTNVKLSQQVGAGISHVTLTSQERTGEGVFLIYPNSCKIGSGAGDGLRCNVCVTVVGYLLYRSLPHTTEGHRENDTLRSRR